MRKEANSALERYNMVQVQPSLFPVEASTNILGTYTMRLNDMHQKGDLQALVQRSRRLIQQK